MARSADLNLWSRQNFSKTFGCGQVMAACQSQHCPTRAQRQELQQYLNLNLCCGYLTFSSTRAVSRRLHVKST